MISLREAQSHPALCAKYEHCKILSACNTWGSGGLCFTAGVHRGGVLLVSFLKTHTLCLGEKYRASNKLYILKTEQESSCNWLGTVLGKECKPPGIRHSSGIAPLSS